MEWVFYLIFLAAGCGLGFLIGRLFSKASTVQAAVENNFLRQQNTKLEQEYSILNEKFRIDFKTIADAVLVDSSRKVQDDSEKRLQAMLTPLREKLGEFQNSISQSLTIQSKDSASLKEQIKQLTELNNSVSAEAKRLTDALRGESKTRGNWGELVLERLLEVSGLHKEVHYDTQLSLKSEDQTLRPDVVIHFPEGKDAIVDSKVSLVHYEQIYATENPADQEKMRKLHVLSIRKHIDDLSGKNYSSLKGINSLDLVFMFVPIEPAFIEALQYDAGLYEYAFSKKIVLLTPSTLLATLRLVGTMWQQYNQTKNSLEIAEMGGKLYDKLAGFVENLTRIGNQMDGAKKTYEEAIAKLSTGRGNLLSMSEKLKELGVKTSKQISLSSDENQ